VTPRPVTPPCYGAAEIELVQHLEPLAPHLLSLDLSYNRIRGLSPGGSLTQLRHVAKLSLSHNLMCVLP